MQQRSFCALNQVQIWYAEYAHSLNQADNSVPSFILHVTLMSYPSAARTASNANGAKSDRSLRNATLAA